MIQVDAYDIDTDSGHYEYEQHASDPQAEAQVLVQILDAALPHLIVEEVTGEDKYDER